ncbi:20927_t:CDS:1, partial [Gigaspora margarita]
LEAFKRADVANYWSEKRMLKIASGYLYGLAANWHKEKRDQLK